MASVNNSKARFYRYSGDGNEPDQRIESEADVFIKELSQKQLRTSTTLKEQLNQKKEFLQSHTYRPITELLSGALPLDEFKVISNDDVDVSKQIVDPNSNCEKPNVSRHIRELALAVKPNSAETKLLEFAISCNAVGRVKSDNRPADHPINQLQVLENDLFGHLAVTGDVRKTAKTILRKRRQLLEVTAEPVLIKTKPKPVTGKSLWDVTEPVGRNEKSSRNKQYGCHRAKFFTIRNGEIVGIDEQRSVEELESVGERIDVERVTSSSSRSDGQTRLSMDEIKKLDKFQNYEKGTPAKTLYLKNLSSRVTEDNLSKLFEEFEEADKPRIIYKLMKTGRMRGQAFVHFHCVEIASKALEKLNGCFVHGKPLIIQFGLSKK